MIGELLLEGRVAVVTGGARGLGATIASRFALEGALGTIVDAAETPSTPVPEGWLYLRADVTDLDQVRDAFDQTNERFGAPCAIVANAGIVPPWTSTEKIDPDEWDRVFSINTRGVMLTIREAARTMTEGGTIVAMSSMNGWKGDPHIPAYAASKHAVVGLVKSAALDLGRIGVRVNAVGPGPIATDALLTRMSHRATATHLDVPDALARAGALTALGRIATADEVASAVLFLTSHLSSGITGHLLPVDGGIL